MTSRNGSTSCPVLLVRFRVSGAAFFLRLVPPGRVGSGRTLPVLKRSFIRRIPHFFSIECHLSLVQLASWALSFTHKVVYFQDLMMAMVASIWHPYIRKSLPQNHAIFVKKIFLVSGVGGRLTLPSVSLALARFRQTREGQQGRAKQPKWRRLPVFVFVLTVFAAKTEGLRVAGACQRRVLSPNPSSDLRPVLLVERPPWMLDTSASFVVITPVYKPHFLRFIFLSFASAIF